ncbi:uncharacterized protein CTHT_0054750 [Thermochaetoides thermophila DSM 1495]|uniref:Uncharacterized protein n=1 Tax=Chaetomium thermophilum (strain DSM 1495 / CBS 144.50 / IMI 039719) TaxID=759272 RepID=G0SBT8_CHATD|nr:hypothetical protein CTHT_0054750 [Thermochaetoides thermophila DSM 1495]EGS18864.1 hypothetical protein CTHT_0054750 [Thermochaetoides thermophila DSM 1495]
MNVKDTPMDQGVASMTSPSQSGPSPTQDDAKVGPGSWNTKKFRDEYETLKNRLLDSQFSVAEYPDPLAPKPPHPKQYPVGTGPTVEQRLLKLISEIKAANEN